MNGDPDYGQRHWRPRPGSSRLLFSVFLISAGTLLFLSNLGLLPIHDVWVLWPLVMIALGIGRLLNAQVAGARFVGILLIGFGTIFFLHNVGLIHIRTHDGSWPLSLLLIAFGVAMLLRVLDAGAWGRPAFGFARRAIGGDLQNTMQDCAIFGSVKRRVDAVDFQGGGAISLFGNVDLDLRRALISPTRSPVTLEATAIFGSIKLRVADGWKVTVHGVGILGSYEDKTIPPNTGDDAPVLIITGYSIFGSVEIED